jgi:hypothetical protein
MMPPTPHDRIEQLLRDQAPVARMPAPPGLARRVMDRVTTSPPASAAPSWRPLFLVLPTSLAAAAALAFYLLPSPVQPPPGASTLAIGIPLDPGPAIRPVARFVTDSIDQPLRDQATALVRDTRRAAQFVVDCIPFARGG